MLKLSMKTWQIWAEGYRDNGGGGGAHLLDTVAAETFDEAVRAHMASLPKTPQYPGGPLPADYYHRLEDGEWRMWGCLLHWDEAVARTNDAVFMRGH